MGGDCGTSVHSLMTRDFMWPTVTLIATFCGERVIGLREYGVAIQLCAWAAVEAHPCR